MIPNTIIAHDAGAVGKAPPAVLGSPKKSSNSSSFADLMATQPNGGKPASKGQPGTGESAASENAAAAEGQVQASAANGAQDASGQTAANGGPEAQSIETDPGQEGREAEHADGRADGAELETELHESGPMAGGGGSGASSDDALFSGLEGADAASETAAAEEALIAKSPGSSNLEGSLRSESEAGRAGGAQAKPDQGAAVQSAGRAAEAVPGQPPVAAAAADGAGAAKDAAPQMPGGGAGGRADASLQMAVPGTPEARTSAGHTVEAGASGGIAQAAAKTGELSQVGRLPAGAVTAQSGNGTDGSRTVPGSGQSNPHANPAIGPATPQQPLPQSGIAASEGAMSAGAAAVQGVKQALPPGLAAVKGAGGQPGSGGLPASGEAGETVLAEGEGAGLSRRIARALGDSAIRMAPTPSSPQVLQSSAAFVQPLLASGLTGGRTEAELLAGSVETLAGTLGLSGEVPGLTQLLAEASIGTNAAHRPEAPRMIAAQLAEAFAAKGEQKVEVSLNPQELGHVRMRVIAAESGITMVIHTERPETGDLMRRHIHELAEEFRRMGYEDVSFEFSGGEAGSGQPGQDSDGGSALARSADAAGAGTADGKEAEKQNLRLGSSGVDMRV